MEKKVNLQLANPPVIRVKKETKLPDSPAKKEAPEVQEYSKKGRRERDISTSSHSSNNSKEGINSHFEVKIREAKKTFKQDRNIRKLNSMIRDMNEKRRQMRNSVGEQEEQKSIDLKERHRQPKVKLKKKAPPVMRK